MPTAPAPPARAFMALLLVLVPGCRAPARMSDVAGRYVMTTGAGVDTLTLDTAGLYLRVHAGTNADGIARDSGEWQLRAAPQRVVLIGLPQRWPAHGNYDPRRGWHVPDTTVRQTFSLAVRRTWRGHVVLEAIPEQGWTFTPL